MMDEVRKKLRENRIFISERLKHALDDCTHKTISVVVAPTGYGKTVAVRTLCERIDMPVVWINIYDTNPIRAWSSFCQAVFSDTTTAEQLEKWPFPAEGAQRLSFVTDFDARLKKGPLTIVFDDYHLIQSPQITEFFQFISREFATRFHLIVISQKQVFDSEETVYATGKINRITSEDLRLQKEDVPAYLELFDISADEMKNKEELSLIYEKSEGWISMIYVSLLSYLRTGKSDPTADMERLVEQAAYRPCSKNTQHFLSFFFETQDFTKEQADFFNDGEDSIDFLTELMKNHAFVRYDHETKMYHIHTIFMNCIRQHFEKLSMVEKCIRYEKMAEYAIRMQDYNKALYWYEKAGNYEGVLRTVELYETIGSETEDRELFLQCFDHCPEILYEDYPLSLILFMWRFFNYGETGRLKKCQNLFEKIIGQIKLAKEDLDYLQKAYAFFLYQNAFNDLDEMLGYLQKAFEYPEKDLPGIDRYVPRNFGNPSVFHMFYRGGNPDDVIDKLLRHKKELNRQNIFSLDGIVEFAKAEEQFLMAHFEEAELLCHDALRMFRKYDLVCCEISAYYLLSQIAYMRGDMDLIRKILDTMIELVLQRGRDHSPFSHMVDMCEAFFHVNLNYPQYLGEWIEDLEHTPKELMPQTEPYSYMIRAATALHRGRFKQILSYKALILASLEQIDSNFTEGALYLIFASAASSLGKKEEAKEYIRHCTKLVGFWPVMLYTYYGRWTMQPLQELAADDERYKDVIVMCRKMMTINRNLKCDSFVGVFPTLTQRENDIALLAMDGLSNKQISAQLFISENTVKSSLKNIFSKLGIKSRRDLLKAAQVGTEF